MKMLTRWSRLLVPLVVLVSCGTPRSGGPEGTTDREGATGEQTLTIALPPGRIADFNRVIGPAFARLTGARVSLVGLRSADQVARVRIERARPTLDVLWIDTGEAMLLAREELLARVSSDEVPNIEEVRQTARSSLGIAPVTFASALGFLYNTEVLSEPPRSWADLWSPRYADRIAMFDFGSNLGPLLLVMAARLNGGSETAIDPGFEKLVELQANVFEFGTSGPANNNLVAQGEAGITFGLANQARDLAANGAPVAWTVPTEGALALPQGFQIVEGAPEAALARRFVDYALSREVQTRLANEMLLVVTNEHVTLDAEVAKVVPLDNILYFDFAVIGARRGEWTNRFNREILGGL